MRPAARAPGARVFNLVLLALGLFLLWQAHAIAGLSSLSSPGALPLAAAAVMVAAAFTALVRTPRASPMAFGEARRHLLPGALIVFATLIAGFASIFERLGFLIAGTLFLALAFRVLGRLSPVRAVSLAVAVVLGLWVLFRLVFQVLLPEGVVPERALLAAIEDALGRLLGMP